MSSIPVFVPYINRPDMLERVLRMIPRRMTTEPVVINNSGTPIDVQAAVMEPPVPLTFVQSQNWMLKEAKERRVPFYMWAHCDALLGPDSVDLLYRRAIEECSRGKWGVIYTYYDILCAYNTAAVEAVGGYDPAFFDYASDCDFYHRLDLSGYPRIESGIKVGHDQGSTTIRSDPNENRRVGIQVDYRGKLYRAMWGGDPGKEVFSVKWGGR